MCQTTIPPKNEGRLRKEKYPLEGSPPRGIKLVTIRLSGVVKNATRTIIPTHQKTAIFKLLTHG